MICSFHILCRVFLCVHYIVLDTKSPNTTSALAKLESLSNGLTLFFPLYPHPLTYPYNLLTLNTTRNMRMLNTIHTPTHLTIYTTFWHYKQARWGAIQKQKNFHTWNSQTQFCNLGQILYFVQKFVIQAKFHNLGKIQCSAFCHKIQMHKCSVLLCKALSLSW